MIKIDGLSYHYGDIEAVKNLSLRVEPGSIHGLLGPDGAGKTTTMRLLASLIKMQKGTIEVNGTPVSDYQGIRSQVGYMPQRFSLYPDLSVAENLEFFANIFGVPANERKISEARLYKFSNLEPFKDRPSGKLSGGMKQKLALMCALIHKPRLLILDEPTTGVDPVSRAEFWKILHNVKEEGIPILVSTPYMDEASQCDEVTLLNKGISMVTGKTGLLTKEAGFHIIKLPWQTEIPAVESLQEIPGFFGIQPFGKLLHLYFQHQSDLPGVIESLKKQNLIPEEEKFFLPEMEDVFIYHMEYKNA